MTEPIQRWGLGSTSQMFSVYGADGEWVRYEDHLATLEAAVAEIKGGQPMTSEHLPECLVPMDLNRGFWVCICKELRACEARIREDYSRPFWAYPSVEKTHD